MLTSINGHLHLYRFYLNRSDDNFVFYRKIMLHMTILNLSNISNRVTSIRM